MSSKKYDLSGKVALVTGSSSGIGLAVARQLAQCGAFVVITGHLADEVKSASDQIEQITGTKPLALSGDLTDDVFSTKLINTTVEMHGQLDILINNAGRMCPHQSLGDSQLMKHYDDVFNLNVRAMFLLINLALPHLEKSKGCIVNTSSIAAFRTAGNPLYCASKAAINMITMSAAQELAPKGIRVNAVNPGPIKTQIGRSVNIPNLFDLPPVVETVKKSTALQRLGEPDEVANMVLFLCSQEASYMTGGTYLVDGGMFCK